MRRIFLDIDDVLIDTYKALKNKSLSEGIDIDPYDVYTDDQYDKDILAIHKRVLTDGIQLMSGALETIKFCLDRHYDIWFPSHCKFREDVEYKKSLLRSLGVKEDRLIVCNKIRKSEVDMRGSLFVDDILHNVIESNADEKIWFKSGYNSFSSDTRSNKCNTVNNHEMLLNYLKIKEGCLDGFIG